MSIFAPTPEIIAYLRAHMGPDASSQPPASNSSPEAVVFDLKAHSHLLSSFVDVHIASVHHDNLIATFLPPFTSKKRDAMMAYWHDQFEDVESGKRVIFLIMGKAADADELPLTNGPIEDSAAAAPGKNSSAGTNGEVLAGYVMLATPTTETGPFRGSVEKFIVSPRFRRRGYGKKLMAKLEQVAKEQGRTLLLLDTVTDSPAEIVYEKLGYTVAGRIPDFGIYPHDGTLGGATFLYKDLRKATALTQ